VQPPSAAQLPPQPTAGQVELSHVTLTPSPVGNAINLQAMLQNNGNTDITGIQVQGTFHGPTGQALGSETAKVQVVSNSNTSTRTSLFRQSNQIRLCRYAFSFSSTRLTGTSKCRSSKWPRLQQQSR